MSFASLGLSDPILKAVTEKGYKKPSPIQSKAIPAILEAKDLMAEAQTGTGKTAGFVLPILERLSKGSRAKSNQVRALILAPTRELAAQVSENVRNYSKYISLSSAVVFGGVKITPQMIRLRRGVDILIATPGRLLDLHRQNAIKFSKLEVLVLDEADHMLDMGFIHDIKRVISLLPKQRQSLMFSATFSNEIKGLAKTFLSDFLSVSVNPSNQRVCSVNQYFYAVEKSKKAELLIEYIKKQNLKQLLIFTKTKHGANRLTTRLNENDQGLALRASAIHGNKTQNARAKALADFKKGKVQILVATDIAARGIDIKQLPHVVNYDIPHVVEDYVHRIGRTGRAGSEGEAISLVTAEDAKSFKTIERFTKQKIEQKFMEGFKNPAEKLDIFFHSSNGKNTTNTRPYSKKKKASYKPGRNVEKRRSFSAKK